MRKLQVKDVLTRIKEPIELEDDVLYKRVTIKTKHQGVFLRDSQYGKDIGTKKQFLINKGQFLLSKIDARNGAFGIVPDEVDGAIITGNFWTYEVNEEELNIELFYIMTSLPFFDELCKNASSGSTNRQYLDEKKFLNQEITLPPIEEQNSFIEHFKKLQEKHSQTLEELQTQSKLINKLRSSILKRAVSGKLVPQDPNDESAEVLLEKIKAEKEKLIKEGKIKKRPSEATTPQGKARGQTPLPPISEDEIPYKLPDGWVWCRLAEILNTVRGGSPRPAGDKRFYDGNIPFLKIADLTKDKNMYVNGYTSSIKEAGLHKTRYIDTETLMLTNSGATLGIPKICNFPTTFNDGIAAFIYMNNELYKPFFYYLLKSKTRWFLQEASRGQGQPNLNTDIIGETLIGLAPFVEQKRIVKKVEKLMATCDALELEVQNSKIETEKLMQSVLKEAFKNGK